MMGLRNHSRIYSTIFRLNSTFRWIIRFGQSDRSLIRNGFERSVRRFTPMLDAHRFHRNNFFWRLSVATSSASSVNGS